MEQQEKNKVKWTGYVALVFIIIFFSGLLEDPASHGLPEWLRFLDFNNILGTFGALGTVGDGVDVTLAGHFQGTGGTGARNGFMFALTLVPAVLLSLGTVKAVEHLDGLAAASKLLNPIMKPLMGVPGVASLSLISSLQSADAGSSMIRSLHEEELMSNQERFIFAGFQMSAGGTLANFFSSGAAMFPFLSELGVPILIPLATIIVFKVIGANLIRLYIQFVMKGEVA